MSTSKQEKTRQENFEWLPLEEAANRYGYAHKESISRRLRQLRKQGFVADIGNPPSAYIIKNAFKNAPIVLFWPNPKTVVLRRDAPKKLLDSRQGKRPKK